MSSSFSFYNPINRETLKANSLASIIDYEVIKRNNPNYILSLFVPLTPGANAGNYQIDGIITNSSMTIGARSNYEDMLPASGFIEKLNKHVTGVGGAITNKPQVALQSLRMSEQHFMGYEVSPISFEMTIPILTSYQESPSVAARTLLTYAVGVRAGDSEYSNNIRPTSSVYSSAANEFVVYAPHRYKVNWQTGGAAGGANDTPEGAATIIVGNYYRFNDMLITDASATFDNIFYNDGKPRRVKLSFTARYWRNPRMGDIASWMRQ